MFTHSVIFVRIATSRSRERTWERTRVYISVTTLEKEPSMFLVVKRLAFLSPFAL